MIRRGIAVAAILISVFGCARSGARTPLPVDAQTTPTPRPRPLPPVARSSADIDDPMFHKGQEVFVTDDGFVPKQLVSIVGEKINFINETDEAVEVRFTAIDFETGTIAPGGRATYTPSGAYSIAYHLAHDEDVRGAIQVEPYFQPGEDPAAEHRLDADPRAGR
jgi:hypothetical protein